MQTVFELTFIYFYNIKVLITYFNTQIIKIFNNNDYILNLNRISYLQGAEKKTKNPSEMSISWPKLNILPRFFRGL